MSKIENPVADFAKVKLSSLLRDGDYPAAARFIRERLPELSSVAALKNEASLLIRYASPLIAEGGMSMNELTEVFSKTPKIYQIEALIDAAYRQPDMSQAQYDNFMTFAAVVQNSVEVVTSGLMGPDSKLIASGRLTRIASRLLTSTPPKRKTLSHRAIECAYTILFSLVPSRFLQGALNNLQEQEKAAGRAECEDVLVKNIKSLKPVRLEVFHRKTVLEKIGTLFAGRGLANALGHNTPRPV